MNRDELERALREADVPDAVGARERARRTVLTAHGQRSPRRAPRAALVWAVVACAVAAVVFSARDTQPAREVRERVRDVFAAPTPAPTAAPAALSGRVLVTEGDELFVVARGRRTSLGHWRDATWSPRGLYVAAANANTLAALDPTDGTVRWKLVHAEQVRFPRWAPGGLHVAYRAGTALRIVYGNGTHDVLAGRMMAPVAPAWRPGHPRTLAWAGYDGTVTVEDADTAKVLWSFRSSQVRQLAWSSDGRRLLVAGRRDGTIHDVVTGARARVRVDGKIVAAAFGRRLALAVFHDGRTSVRVNGETVLSAPGRLRNLEWSPDGRSLLAAWPGADHWLVVRGREVSAVRHRFGGAGRVRGWATP
ncbi:hypothetical protein OJ997_26365 [Solirubrobacter phytolaccae]|uniref:WD40 repeat domain-containing protein n=1 Tax=Solirubrobacter phytolaccae TaxID=1404360 RepID=A0A9X3SAM1_9ACTN|nr:hypothetical protein [Solirubrobacter phytolaccae]MDA0183858.1 hypothetical protein [Solirubrobacter phytolaccae]